jgi:hypothetical protein
MELVDTRSRQAKTKCTLTKNVFLTQVDQGLYLTEEEEGDGPERGTRHKGHILKVMFLTAVTRPRFNDRGECTFNGKIGLWPFVRQEAAQ